MKSVKFFTVVAAMVLLFSCAKESNIFEKSVLENLSDEEIEQLEKSDHKLAVKCKAIHAMVVVAGMENDSSLREVSYQRFMDFMDYRPDTAVFNSRIRKEWNDKYAEMDTLAPEYMTFEKYHFNAVNASMYERDSLCAEVWNRTMSHIHIMGVN